MTDLSVLYHWSPSSRRQEIRVRGLVPFAPPTISSGGLAYPYICLSPDPATAWSLSGDMAWVTEIEEWDLWLVWLPDKAEAHVRPTWGSKIEEVKVYSTIPPDRLWFVGVRDAPYAKEVVAVPDKLPFKITAQTKGAQKAYSAMIEQYGQSEGTRIFLAKAEEQGTGRTLREKVNSVYRKGAKLK